MSTVTISIPGELESKVHRGASRRGVSENEYIIQALERSVRVDAANAVPHLSADETHLFQAINVGLPEETWDEYHNLANARDDGSLTTTQRERFLEILNMIEIQNSRRIGVLAQLAEVRQVSLRELMDSLGIVPPDSG
jgi:hypothetical protein